MGMQHAQRQHVQGQLVTSYPLASFETANFPPPCSARGSLRKDRTEPRAALTLSHVIDLMNVHDWRKRRFFTELLTDTALLICLSLKLSGLSVSRIGFSLGCIPNPSNIPGLCPGCMCRLAWVLIGIRPPRPSVLGPLSIIAC